MRQRKNHFENPFLRHEITSLADSENSEIKIIKNFGVSADSNAASVYKIDDSLTKYILSDQKYMVYRGFWQFKHLHRIFRLSLADQ